VWESLSKMFWWQSLGYYSPTKHRRTTPTHELYAILRPLQTLPVTYLTNVTSMWLFLGYFRLEWSPLHTPHRTEFNTFDRPFLAVGRTSERLRYVCHLAYSSSTAYASVPVARSQPLWTWILLLFYVYSKSISFSSC
jgi:hypothetical protein